MSTRLRMCAHASIGVHIRTCIDKQKWICPEMCSDKFAERAYDHAHRHADRHGLGAFVFGTHVYLSMSTSIHVCTHFHAYLSAPLSEHMSGHPSMHVCVCLRRCHFSEGVWAKKPNRRASDFADVSGNAAAKIAKQSRRTAVTEPTRLPRTQAAVPVNKAAQMQLLEVSYGRPLYKARAKCTHPPARLTQHDTPVHYTSQDNQLGLHNRSPVPRRR